MSTLEIPNAEFDIYHISCRDAFGARYDPRETFHAFLLHALKRSLITAEDFFMVMLTIFCLIPLSVFFLATELIRKPRC